MTNKYKYLSLILIMMALLNGCTDTNGSPSSAGTVGSNTVVTGKSTVSGEPTVESKEPTKTVLPTVDSGVDPVVVLGYYRQAVNNLKTAMSFHFSEIGANWQISGFLDQLRNQGQLLLFQDYSAYVYYFKGQNVYKKDDYGNHYSMIASEHNPLDTRHDYKWFKYYTSWADQLEAATARATGKTRQRLGYPEFELALKFNGKDCTVWVSTRDVPTLTELDISTSHILFSLYNIEFALPNPDISGSSAISSMYDHPTAVPALPAKYWISLQSKLKHSFSGNTWIQAWSQKDPEFYSWEGYLSDRQVGWYQFDYLNVNKARTEHSEWVQSGAKWSVSENGPYQVADLPPTSPFKLLAEIDADHYNIIADNGQKMSLSSKDKGTLWVFYSGDQIIELQWQTAVNGLKLAPSNPGKNFQPTLPATFLNGLPTASSKAVLPANPPQKQQPGCWLSCCQRWRAV